MPYNREKCLKNLIPTRPGEVRNPYGRPIKAAAKQASAFLDADPNNCPPPKTRFQILLEAAYKHAVYGDIEFAGRYQEMLFRFAVENKHKEMELKLKALALLDPGIKDGKYTTEEVAQRLALVEGTATDVEAETVSSEPASEETDGESD